jgi:hypothetical protein
MAKIEALRRRIVPAVVLQLDLDDDSGEKFSRTFRLSFDFNAFALIQEKTGVDMTGLRAWARLNPSTLSIMFWAACLACSPEYAGDEGLGVLRSYMDVSNEELIGAKLFEAYAAALPEAQRKLLLDLKARLDRGEDPTSPPAETGKPAETVTSL